MNEDERRPFLDNWVMRQYAPYPFDLADLVKQSRTHGWEFELLDEERDPVTTHGGSAGGLTLEIRVTAADPYNSHPCPTCAQPFPNSRTRFLFPVPAATYDRQTWLDWLGDCMEHTGLHEIREGFSLEWLEDDPEHQDMLHREERPFAPNHGPGRDPYRRYSYATDEDRRTSFRGEVKSTVEDA